MSLLEPPLAHSRAPPPSPFNIMPTVNSFEDLGDGFAFTSLDDWSDLDTELLADFDCVRQEVCFQNEASGTGDNFVFYGSSAQDAGSRAPRPRTSGSSRELSGQATERFDPREDGPCGPQDHGRELSGQMTSRSDPREDHQVDGFKYKKVADKIRPVAQHLPERFRMRRSLPHDPLANLVDLPSSIPPFEPGLRFTAERRAEMKLNPDGFLWPEEERLVEWLFRTHEDAFAWTEAERGSFRDDYFDPVKIATVEHEPWRERNIPIPPGLRDKVISILREKIAAGVYEPSNSSYRTKYFCVLKKDGVSLRMVHDLQPLNAATIMDAALPPTVEEVADDFAGRGVYSGLDLIVAFDQRMLDAESRDYTTFLTPIGLLRHTRLPMGWTNSMQVLQADVVFILQEEIPRCAEAFIDDVSVKGPRTRYELPGGDFERHWLNKGIRRFIWEHLLDVHRILHRMRMAGGTFSGPKSKIATPTLVFVGQVCTYEGRIADPSKVQKVRDWPACTSISDVRAFLGTLGTIRMWIKDFAKIARPLNQLLRKELPYCWTLECQVAHDELRRLAVAAPCLRPIDYSSDRQVILAVDTSMYAIGWILYVIWTDGKRYPNRFDSITLNDREGRYSQAKLELYGLFRALKDARRVIIGVRNLVVEVDAKYIKGMLNQPDIQPSATINRWIAGILLFTFELVHVPAESHRGPDGLSRRPRAVEDAEYDNDDDHEDWLDNALGLRIELLHEHRMDLEQSRLHVVDAFALANPDGHGAWTNDGELVRTAKELQDDEVIAVIHEVLQRLRRPTCSEKVWNLAQKNLMRYFVDSRGLMRKDKTGRHRRYVFPDHRLKILRQAHDELGHKGFYVVAARLSHRFWWPGLQRHTKEFLRTCHPCQERSTAKVHLPITVQMPLPLFHKAYVDTMMMPNSRAGRYLTQARCSLSSWPEFRILKAETAEAIGRFIFEEILCRWGALAEIVTDNGKAFVSAVDWLARTYGIHHIRISAYNSQANGAVESKHFPAREAVMKLSEDRSLAANHWPKVVHAAFWAERVTIRRSIGYSPYWMAHGVEPLLPFDLAEATFLTTTFNAPLSTAQLVEIRARQLLMRDEDLAEMHRRVLAARFASAERFTKQFENTTADYNFAPGSWVMIRNTKVEKELSRKHKKKYLGPYIVLRRREGGSYICAELDGAISRMAYAAFRLVPYFPRRSSLIDIEELTGLSTDEIMTQTRDIPTLDVELDPAGFEASLDD